MKINHRIIIILCVAVVSLLLALTIISAVSVLGTFEQIEYRQMSISTQDVLAKLDAEVEDLAAFCRLWARSDALYAFMEDEDHRFPPGRIDDPALFRDMKVSYILLYDSSGSLVHAWGYRGDTGPVDAMPQELDRIIRDSIIPPGSGEGISGRRGYALLDGGPVILAGYHIVQPGGEGEPRGTLVMVRTLDQQAIESLAQQGELGISFLSQDSSGTAAFTGSDRAQMERGAVLVMPVNDTVMQGAAFITGIENTPTRILVRVHLARPVHQLVRTSLFSIALVTGVLTGILVLAIRWPLKKYVVDPLVSIDAALAEIGSSGDIFRTVPVSGDDEIRSLAASLNQMLDEIRSGQGKIRESEARFRTLIENTPDIVLSLDCDGRFTYVSPQVEQYGYSAAHLFGQSAFDLILPDDRESIRESFRHAMSEGRGDSAPFRILDPLQNVHWFEVKSTAIRDAAGQSTGLQAVIRDITERRRAMDAIALANKKLNLMYDITRHDILNKITVLFGLIDMTSASASAAERDEFLAGIRDAGQAIYRQILLTRDYQEVGVKSPRWLRLRDLIERATAGFSGHGVRFVMKTDGEEVFADPLIEKVIYNLADNAIRYGKTITTITFTSRAAGDVLELVCEDDGVGIEDSEKEKIFERGFGKNTGLGLFLTREILMITGITIREDGESGKGARFIITFPRGAFRSPGGDDRGPTNPAT